MPVHCKKILCSKCVDFLGLKTEVIGKWQFRATADTFDVDLGNFETVCTHRAPNRMQILLEDKEIQLLENDDGY